jgi:Ammonium Transporter Family
VAVCAGCNAYHPWASFVVGVIAGVQFILWINLIAKAGIDDPMDTFAGKHACRIYFVDLGQWRWELPRQQGFSYGRIGSLIGLHVA